jgi:CHAT domain-containing protein
VLVGGLTQSVQGFPELPSVGQEVAEIGRIAAGGAAATTTTLMDGAFTSAALEGSLSKAPFSVVHLASHGIFGGDPKDSFILTFDGRLDMDELERLVRLGQSAASRSSSCC